MSSSPLRASNAFAIAPHSSRRVGAAWLAVAIVVMSLIAICLSQPSASASWRVYSPSNPSYPQKVDFVVECYFVKNASIDPIVFPGMAGMSHPHTFGGALKPSAFSSAESLLAGGTNCKQSGDKSAYWMPTLYNDGRAVYPLKSRAYYRAGSFRGASIKPMPFGLKIVAGDAMATKPQDGRVAGFQCRNTSGNSVPKQALPIRCPSGDFLEASVVFPNCWNGVDLDSVNHKSHLAYADWATHTCPAGYPVQIPQLTYANRYPVDALRGRLRLATMGTVTNSKYTLHADLLDAWDTATMDSLTRNCINASIACEDVTDRRMPPGS